MAVLNTAIIFAEIVFAAIIFDTIMFNAILYDAIVFVWEGNSGLVWMGLDSSGGLGDLLGGLVA